MPQIYFSGNNSEYLQILAYLKQSKNSNKITVVDTGAEALSIVRICPHAVVIVDESGLNSTN